MNWAHFAIQKLQKGESATITPHGHSMTGKVNDGDTVVLNPVEKCDECIGGKIGEYWEHPGWCDPCPKCEQTGHLPKLNVDDIVLVKVKGKVYLHLIKAVKGNGMDRQYQIGNNKGGINGWVSINAIYGIAAQVVAKGTR